MDEGEAGKREGMARVAAGADPAFMAAMRVAIILVARANKTLVSEQCLELVESKGFRTRDNRAVGPTMNDAKKDGLIEPTPVYVRCKRARRHKGPTRVWNSLIYKSRAYDDVGFESTETSDADMGL